MRSSAILAALSISGAFAKPTIRHSHRHAKKDYDLSKVDWSKVNYDFSSVDWSKVDFTGGKGKGKGAPAAANAAPAENNDNASTTSSEDSSNPVGDLIEDALSTVNDKVDALFSGIKGISNTLKEFGDETAASGNFGDFYLGNVGSPYCSNVIKVDSAEGYDYTNEIINTSGDLMTVVVWNKAGSDGQVLSGGALANKEACLTITLEPNARQVVAFQSDSQVAFAQATKDTTFSGHFATTFAECNYPKAGGPTCNLSSILNKNGNTYKMSITNAQNDCCSSEKENSWVTETKTLNGLDGKDRNGSCYVPGMKGNFKTEMGGQQ